MPTGGSALRGVRPASARSRMVTPVRPRPALSSGSLSGDDDDDDVFAEAAANNSARPASLVGSPTGATRQHEKGGVDEAHEAYLRFTAYRREQLGIAGLHSTGSETLSSEDEEDVPTDQGEDEQEGWSQDSSSGLDDQHVRDDVLLASHVRPGGVVARDALSTGAPARAERESARKYIQHVINEVANRQHEVEIERRKVEKAVEDARGLEEEVGRCERRAVKLSRSVGAKRPYELSMERNALKKLKSEHAASLAVVEESRRFLTTAEEALGAAEVERSKLIPLEEQLAAVDGVVRREAEVVAKYRVERERQDGEALVARQEREDAAAAAEVQKIISEVEDGMEAAEESRRRARQRLRKLSQKASHTASEEKDAREAADRARLQAILDLKRATETAHAEMRATNMKKKQREDARRRKENEERAALLASGQNPEEVFRRRRFNAQRSGKKSKKEAEKTRKSMAIVARVMAEEERYQRKMRKQRKADASIKHALAHRSTEDKYAANEKYLEERTISGTGLADPGGLKTHVAASEVSIVKGWKPTLGRHTEKVRRQVRDDLLEQESKRRSKKVRVQEEDDYILPPINNIDKLEDATPSSHDKEQAPLPLVDELLVPEFNGLWSEPPSTTESKPLFKFRYTKLQEQRMAANKAKRRANVSKKQTVAHKEFKGIGFECSPRAITFKDFEVGHTYTCAVTLTNVSFGFNAFKLGTLPLATRDFFEFRYKPPGAMSAGLTCQITVIFTPKISMDIDTELPVIAETGGFGIAVICRTKKCRVKLSSAIVDFGRVVSGETATKSARIINEGAVEASMTFVAISSTHPHAASSETDEEDIDITEEPYGDTSLSSLSLYSRTRSSRPRADVVSVFKLQPSSQTSASYGEIDLSISFAPPEVGEYSVTYQVQFDDENKTQLRLLVKGEGSHVPVYVKRTLMDFKTCYYGQLYRDALLVSNRGHVTQKIKIDVPSCFEGIVSFHPNVGFVQGDSDFLVQVKFRPTEMTLERCRQFRSAAPDSIRVPITITAKDQILPATFDIRAQLTTSDISLDPPVIDFGGCPITDAVAFPLYITNKSCLAQRFGFLDLPKGLEVQPDDGFGVILPYERLRRLVVFHPSVVGDFSAQLSLRSAVNKEFSVTVKGKGIRPPLAFNSPQLLLPSTAIGSTSTAAVYLENTSKVAHTFDIGPPAGSHLTVSPAVGTIQPGAAARIEIHFEPVVDIPLTLPDEEEEEEEIETLNETTQSAKRAAAAEGRGTPRKKSGAIGSKKDAKAAKKKSKSQREGSAESEEPRVPRLSLAERMEQREKVLSSFTDRTGACVLPCFIKNESHPIYLRVRAPIVSPPLVVTSGNGQPRLHFGRVPTAQGKVGTIVVRNISEVEQPLRGSALDPFGVFTVLSALRPLPPGGSIDITVRFEPTLQAEYLEVFTLTTPSTSLQLQFVGTGSQPSLTIDPVDTVADFEDVLANDEPKTKTFTLANTSSLFDVHYTITLARNGERNLSGINAFSAEPCEAVLRPGDKVDVVVSFSPDHECMSYSELMVVHIPNESENHEIVLRGRGRMYSLYLEGYNPLPMDRNRMRVPAALVGLPDKGDTWFVDVDISWDGSGMASRDLVVGNLKGRTAKGTGEFDVLPLDADAIRNGFAVDQTRATVEAGGLKTIKITFEPPNEVLALASLSGEKMQCVETTIVCVLRGGAPALPDNGRTYRVRVRGTVAQEHIKRALAREPQQQPSSARNSTPRRTPKKKSH